MPSKTPAAFIVNGAIDAGHPAYWTALQEAYAMVEALHKRMLALRDVPPYRTTGVDAEGLPLIEDNSAPFDAVYAAIEAANALPLFSGLWAQRVSQVCARHLAQADRVLALKPGPAKFTAEIERQRLAVESSLMRGFGPPVY